MPIDEIAITLRSDAGQLASAYWLADAPRQELLVNIYGELMSVQASNFNFVLVKHKDMSREIGVGIRDGWRRAAFDISEANQITTSTAQTGVNFFRNILRRGYSLSHKPLMASFKQSVTEGKPFPISALEARETLRIYEEILDEIERLKQGLQLR